MNHFFKLSVGLLRLIAFFEGISLLTLLFIAMPLKYFLGSPSMVKYIGQIHGILFLVYIAFALIVSIQKKWIFFEITWKVLLSSIIPLGTFYIDRTILKNAE